MTDDRTTEVQRKRTWREIAYDMTHETERAKIIALSQELSKAFEVQERRKLCELPNKNA